MPIKSTGVTLAGALLFTSSAVVLAEPVTFEITATVFQVSDPGNGLQSSVQPGDVITGTYTVDTAAIDNEPNSEYGYYSFNSSAPSSPQLGFDLLVNGMSFKSDPTVPGHMFEAHVLNSYSDHFSLVSWGNVPLANGSSVDDIFLDLYDHTGLALSSDQLTNQAPSVTAFEYHDLHISGSTNNYDYYYLDARIDSIKTVGGECPATATNPVTLSVSATVREVYDYDNVLAGAVNVGDVISGTYTYNTDTPDIDPAPEYGRYEHFPGSGNYGFNITLANTNLKTDTNQAAFYMTIVDGQGWPDTYAAETFGSQIPFINNSFVESIGMFVDDPSGNMVNGTTLTNQPPLLPEAGYKDFYLTGFRNGATYSSFFSIVADVNSVTSASTCVHEEDPVEVSPASGVFDIMQNFDAAIITKPNLPPVVNMQATLNGFDITPSLDSCFPGSPNSENRQVLLCPELFGILYPGENMLKFTFVLEDGSQFTHTVDWYRLGSWW